MALREKEGQRLHHPDIFTQKTDYDLSAYYNQALARKEQLSHLDGDDMPTNSIILALPKAFERVRTERGDAMGLAGENAEVGPDEKEHAGRREAFAMRWNVGLLSATFREGAQGRVGGTPKSLR
ncbi:unnamed protein product [Cylicocyclus nassatus]|uniref:Uncharacterized protein n=1 Tax=Cylicocyclus nassatus TaxID=53992 RepID=A0AA36M3Y8_CYLNA|nr:unnamed protein product [Cylicocyclus nassatus]